MFGKINNNVWRQKTAAISEAIERHHKLIIGILIVIILFFIFACIFDNVIPVCHWLFQCDHAYHAMAQ